MQATFALPLCILFFGSADLRSARAAQEHEHPVPEKLGVVSFPTSCSATVQKQFERAVSLLHSFAYSAAEKSFRDVVNAGPEMRDGALGNRDDLLSSALAPAAPGRERGPRARRN